MVILPKFSAEFKLSQSVTIAQTSGKVDEKMQNGIYTGPSNPIAIHSLNISNYKATLYSPQNSILDSVQAENILNQK